MKKLLLILIIFIGCEKESNSNPKGLKTKNLILITLDGVRWEEVFLGADSRIIMNNVKDEKIREHEANIASLKADVLKLNESKKEVDLELKNLHKELKTAHDERTHLEHCLKNAEEKTEILSNQSSFSPSM